jgi:hypothetical protein
MAKNDQKGKMKSLSGPHQIGPAWQVPGYATGVFIQTAASMEHAQALAKSIRNSGTVAKAAPHLHR